MLTAIYAARNITGERNDIWSVNTEMEYHEEIREAKAGAGDRAIPMPVTLEEEALADELIEAVFARLDAVALGAAAGAVMGLGVFLATAILLLKGGPVVGPTLSLLSQYLIGYSVSWRGALVGLIEGGIVGFVLGSLTGWSWNWMHRVYAYLVRRKAEADAERDLLDKV